MARRNTGTSTSATPEATETAETPEAPAASVPSTLGDARTPEERMTVLKNNHAAAKKAVKTAKAALAQAKKDHTAAKNAVEADNNDTLLAAAQAEQAAFAADKAVKSAEKAVKTAAGKIETETAKQNEIRADKAKADGFLTTIKADGKEIVTRLQKAADMEGKADDHRLAAALKMAEVEGKFAETKPKGVTFRKWCEAQAIVAPDIRGRSWENVRKLLAVGKADDPQQALTDMREGNRAAVAKNREKNKANAGSQTSASPASPGGASPASPGGATAAETPLQRIESILGGMKDEEAANAAASIAQARGLKMVASDAIVFSPTAINAMQQVKQAIGMFTPAERMSLAEWLTEQIEADITAKDNAPAGGGGEVAGGIPGFLRRSDKDAPLTAGE